MVIRKGRRIQWLLNIFRVFNRQIWSLRSMRNCGRILPMQSGPVSIGFMTIKIRSIILL